MNSHLPTFQWLYEREKRAAKRQIQHILENGMHDKVICFLSQLTHKLRILCKFAKDRLRLTK